MTEEDNMAYIPPMTAKNHRSTLFIAAGASLALAGAGLLWWAYSGRVFLDIIVNGIMSCF